MLMHDGLRTTDDDGHQPIAIGHLSDSCDLKINHVEVHIFLQITNLRFPGVGK